MVQCRSVPVNFSPLYQPSTLEDFYLFKLWYDLVSASESWMLGLVKLM